MLVVLIGFSQRTNAQVTLEFYQQALMELQQQYTLRCEEKAELEYVNPAASDTDL
jgi:hypothetical protein